MYLPCIYHVSTARDHWPPQPLFTILNQQRGSGNVAWRVDTQQTRAYLARTERGRNEDQLLYCHHSAIFLTKYCDLRWCHCSVRCGHKSASILTLKQYLAKVPTFHVQCSDCVEVPFYNSVSTSVKQRQCIPFDHPGFSFCCQGFPLVTKIFPLVTKDFPFVNASTQPTEPFHIHSLLHSYVGIITNRFVWH